MKPNYSQKCLLFVLILFTPIYLAAQSPVRIGLNADMSSGSAQAGEAIRRGILIALHEINQSGGIFGRQVELMIKDHRGIPARGRRNMKQFSKDASIIAIFGGLHTPVVLAEKKELFDSGKIKIPYLIPWAAGTPITDNPWIFRLSVRDEYAGGFLINKALENRFSKIALLLELTPWGRGNEKSMKTALAGKKMLPQTIEWFSWSVEKGDIAYKLEKIYQAQADVIMLVANAPEGATIVKQMAMRPPEKRIPIISHWGITGGRFPETVGKDAMMSVNLKFLQTFSFIKQKSSGKVQQLLKIAGKLFKKNRIVTVEDFQSPVGTAHAYDLTHLLHAALKQAGTEDRIKVRSALEHLPRINGIVRSYDPAFKPGIGKAHDALSADDFMLSEYRFSANKWIIK
ncbi:MAG: ABC transporter substrate-binding protein [Deltaproteobacteria bacterium]|nr:ABC transporter substrate-binding protein [Deltaproteobacteria bacterium]MBT4264895.1 ABC transporter substrate-binding protein [Deltaproteobacteria bacterium]MBT4638812.1 ABC transporter substrate-binding protein [Deltaproteobacteria bacterium]MBT6502212.1 ABC transporter substrate-binding protein [Deltaproteobacteria bacterium]MBT7716659.1 ABC transporter substrate-binding protein [Deltaproteobacteria bacterium]